MLILRYNYFVVDINLNVDLHAFYPFGMARWLSAAFKRTLLRRSQAVCRGGRALGAPQHLVQQEMTSS